MRPEKTVITKRMTPAIRARLSCVHLKTAVLALLIAGSGLGSAGARADDGQRIRSGPCSSIITSFCPEPDLTDADLFKCLQSHRAQRSEACNEDLSPMLLDIEKVPEKCRADVVEACSAASEGEVMKCLKTKHLDLSPQCRIALEEGR
jgi:hypothetical protein